MKIVKDINEIFYKSTDVEQLLQKKKKKKQMLNKKRLSILINSAKMYS